MIIIFFVVLTLGTLLYLLSRKKYGDFIHPINKEFYPLKPIIPMGLYILDTVGYKFSTKYDKKLITKINLIFGIKYSQYYLRIHWANKISFLFIGMLLMSLIGIGTGPDKAFGVFSVCVLVAIVYLTDAELDKKIKRRSLQIQLDFPDFINKLTLLINAGMTISRAWERIASSNYKNTPLYEELKIVISDIRSGKSEQQAFEDFSKRCRMPEITRFVSVIIQNLRKGSGELVSILRVQANDCWELRKNAAKRLSEEASTKMLLPMMIMFIAILIIVAIPAVLAMKGI